jgi:hypothetical protein
LDGRGVEVRDMRDAEMTLAIIRERGRNCHTAIPAGRPTRTRPTQDPADWTSTTGEPCAAKVACTVRRGADGKGPS